jgi:hypothetical protein
LQQRELNGTHKCAVYADDADVFEKALMSFRKTQMLY